jgi:trafficking protein particle complex subunit 9
LPVDFLRLSFDDSTIAPAHAALAEGELSIYDAYETEYQLINQPVLSWNREQEDTGIPPGKKVVIAITCTGKVGWCVPDLRLSVILLLMVCSTSGGILISYGYIHRRQSIHSQPSEMFHTRQISYPVLVTVYHMLECYNMDILPLSVRDHEAKSAPRNKRQELLKGVEEDGWCLFSIDVRNTYGLPFEVTLERVQKGWEIFSACEPCLTVSSIDAAPVSTSCIVAPGAMIRYTTSVL